MKVNDRIIFKNRKGFILELKWNLAKIKFDDNSIEWCEIKGLKNAVNSSTA